MMLSKHLTNVIQNLEKKKFRGKYNLFKLEGEKLVSELCRSEMNIDTLIATPEWIATHPEVVKQHHTVEVNHTEMGRLSHFKSPPEVIALAEIPDHELQAGEIGNSLSLVLNGIQDPGNLGTILRICDWFGIRSVFCDHDCAGAYNPKVIQASMGAILRVKVYYLDLLEFLPVYRKETFPCYGTFLNGQNIYTSTLKKTGFIIMGNEGGGISPAIERLVDYRLTIPGFAPEGETAESLNVGVATGIVLSEFKRKEYYN